MRHKHKAKRSARYKKQHGVDTSDSVSRGKKTKGERKEGVDHDLNEKEKPKSTLIVKQRELAYQDGRGYGEKSYSKRKIEINWSKYEDFSVEDVNQEEKRTTRGADFKSLISQPGGAASQLRMKDEKWDESDAPDDHETDIGDLFKVDFREVADRLKVIPLHERLGIPEKYFEKNLLDIIKDDAARHAARVEQLLKEEQASRIKKQADTSISVLRDGDYEDNVSVVRDSYMVETVSDTISCKDEHIDCSTQSNRSQLESTLDLHQNGNNIASGTCSQHVSSTTVSHGKSEESRTDSTDSSSVESPLLGKSTEVPSETQSKDTDDLEDWLDEHLLDSD